MACATPERIETVVSLMKSHLMRCGYKPSDVNSATFKFRNKSLEEIARDELWDSDENEYSSDIARSTIDEGLLNYHETNYDRRMVEFSFFPLAYAIARIKLDDELPEMDYDFTSEIKKGDFYPTGGYIGRHFKGQSLLLHWSSDRKQWVAFNVINIPLDMMYGETNYSYARGLNNNLRARLLEAYNLQPTEEALSRVERTSPEELKRANSFRYKIIKSLKRMFVGENKCPANLRWI